MDKQTVNVHEKGTAYGSPGQHVETIKRKLWGEPFGNFNPIFCRYKGRRYLVHSMAGDLSDPFRRDESYLTNLYIEITPKRQLHKPDCPTCSQYAPDAMFPPHDASAQCESGNQNHCTCDVCF